MLMTAVGSQRSCRTPNVASQALNYTLKDEKLSVGVEMEFK